MSLPYFPMYPKDFEAKTSHLTLAEDGAFNRLLRICWMTPDCTMPDDEAWIMRRARAVSDADQEAVRAVLREFFTAENGRLSNARICSEFEAVNLSYEKRKNAGKAGGKAKALQRNKKTPSNATAMLKQPEPEPEPVKKERAKALCKKGTRIGDDWLLPKSCGEWAMGEGLSVDQIRLEADKFRDYWISQPGQKGVKRDWRATWRNWIRHAKARGRPSTDGRIGKEDRMRQIITAAATGTTERDWG